MPSLFVVGAAAALAGGGLIESNARAQPAQWWEIGPILGGRNLSAGAPLAPITAGGGWYFDFPNPDPKSGHVHYLTTRTGALAGKSRIVIRFRIDAAPGVRIVPRSNPGSAATLTLYFQRRGDNWSGRGPFEHFRWYSTPANRLSLSAGEHQLSLPLDGRNWKSVMAAKGDEVPEQFRDALRNAERVGFVLGGGGSAGHGVYATGPARFTLIGFEVR